jgi:hypothetical protein
MSPRDAFSGCDNLVIIDAGPEDALTVLMQDKRGGGDSDTIEPALDE